VRRFESYRGYLGSMRVVGLWGGRLCDNLCDNGGASRSGQVGQNLGGALHQPGRDVAVGAQGERDSGVPQQVCHHPGRNTALQQERGCGVPEVV